MSLPEPHIHQDCIVAWAADPTRKVHVNTERYGVWVPMVDSKCSPNWNSCNAYRVFDHDGTVLAETPPPNRKVRIPETVLPAPVENREDIKAITYYAETSNAWLVSTATQRETPHSVAIAFSRNLAFESAEEAQQWADFLNTQWETVE